MNNRYNRSRHGIHNLTRPEIVADLHRYIDSITELGPIFFDEVGKLWMYSGYAESPAALVDSRHFSSTRTNDAGELLGRGFPDAAEVAGIIREQLLRIDSPEHDR